DQRSHVPMIQQLNLKAEGWRQAELARARKQLAKGQDLESVLESVTLGLMKKMLNGPLRELNQQDAPAREQAKSAVEQFFLKP
ncbi:MAG: glutamyl-tRNA reductase, partial [Curvibacter sp.]